MKTKGINPKDLIGSKKVSITKLPPVAILHGAHAMMDGARKYGPYNWREKPILASVYIDAAMRHLEAYFSGEQIAQDSKVHHLGHAIGCCAILLDAEAYGNLVDDRPDNLPENYLKVVDELTRKIKEAVEIYVPKKSNGRAGGGKRRRQ